MTQCTSHDHLDRLRPLLSTRTQSPHLPPQEQVLTGLLSSSRAVTIVKPGSGPNWQMFMDYLLDRANAVLDENGMALPFRA